MRFIRGHNNVGMDRSRPRTTHYVVEDRGYVTPCWTWQLRKGGTGYGHITVKSNDHLAHRWYYEQAKGPIPDGLQLDHLCRNRDCVNPDHMEPVTPLENTRRSRSMKLTLEQAQEIQRLLATGLSAYKIAPMFGVSTSTVYLIKKNGVNGPRRPR